MAIGNREVTDLPLLSAVNGSDLYAVKSDQDYRVKVGGPNGLVYFDTTGRLASEFLQPNLATFDPSTKASLGADVTFRDITTNRGDGTGVLWFGGNDGYLYYKNANSFEFRFAGQYAVLNAPGTIFTTGNFNPNSKLDVASYSWNTIPNKPTYFPTDWATVTGKPTVFPTTWGAVEGKPTTFPTDWANVASKPAFHAVATSGNYNDLANKPTSMPPTGHTHAAGDITSGVMAVARLGSGSPTTSTFLRGDGTWATVAATTVIDWEGVQNKPATATRWPDWNEVTGKPGSYTPSAHTHAAADVTSGVFDVARIPDITQSKVTGLAAALDAKASLAGANFTGATANLLGAVGTQTIFHSYGWNNGIARWRWVIEPNASMSLYSYDAGGGQPNPALSIATAEAGGADQIAFKGNIMWHAGNFDPASKANLSGAVFTGEVATTAAHGYRMVHGNYGTFWRNDGGDLYQMITASGDPYGGWSGIPLRLNLASGTYYYTTRPVFAGATPWDSGNFNPDTKANVAGQVFTGTVEAPNFTTRASTSLGWMTASAGSATNPGSTGYFTPDGVRRGYIGWAEGSNLLLASENGWRWRFNETPNVAGNDVWHAGNFDPATYNAATATRLATARTINGTGFNGSANITTANWGTARTLTLGASGKSVNGSANVSWTLAEMGAVANGGSVATITKLTQAAYDALGTKDANTLYVIVG